MKIEQLELGAVSELRVRLVGDDPLPSEFAARCEVWLLRPEGVDEIVLRRGDAVVLVAGARRRDVEQLEMLCRTGLPRVTWLLDVAQGSRELLVQVHTFAERLTGELEFALDERSLEAVRAANRRVRNMREAIGWLSEQCLLPGSPTPEAPRSFARAFLSAGTGRDREGSFRIHGSTVRLIVRRVQEAAGPGLFLIERVVRGRGQDAPSLFLAEGAIGFVDHTTAARVRMDVQAQIANLAAEQGGFIDLWSRYGQAEADTVLQRARTFGVHAYESFETPPGLIRFTLSEQARERLGGISEGDELEAAGAAPSILTTAGMTWAEYEQEERSANSTRRASPFVGKVKRLHVREGKLDLEVRDADEMPPAKGVLFMSVLGDRTRLKRRRLATEMISRGENPMCQLRLLLEGGRLPPAREGRLPALTPEVRKKVFGNHGPTPKQEEALRVALNTPDVALIQGPPGTGKTTVITALAERLNQELDSSDGIAGSILLTGFQHDAVENAIARMSLNGLPLIKFGARGGGDEDVERTEAALERWCQERAQALSKKLPPRPPSPLDEEMAAQFQGYLLAPTPPEETAALLTRTAERVAGLVPSRLIDEIRKVRDGLLRRRTDNPARRELVRCIRALRVDPRAFADDGPLTARRLLRALRADDDALFDEEEVSPETRALLEKAADWMGAEPPFLHELAALRRRLLLRFAPSAIRDVQPRLSSAVLNLLVSVRDAVVQTASPRDAADDAAAELLAALQGDPEEVKRSLLSYMAVHAATCQQSERLWSKRRDDEEPYNTVIVDEAARANPLDLFIPMARAGQRIVLVGDHRQLPHMLDRQLEEELERTLKREAPAAAERTRELLNQSLFQRLYESLQKRHEQGEVQRTVTLGEQYRMHQTLGRFLSREFYEPFPGEGFTSPLPDSLFAHALPGYEGTAAAWLNVPMRQDKEVPGPSKSRPVEAKALVSELKRLIDHAAGAALNFGIITFYSAQVSAIRQELRAAGLTDEEGQIVEPYRDLVRPDGKRVERLRYGTVDAFQGMEFDVVFLSMVRSNDRPGGDEAALRKKYGHLMSPNRLCVSMSRQKRLLVVVGDTGMLRHADAERAIGPLVRFHAMCREVAPW